MLERIYQALEPATMDVFIFRHFQGRAQLPVPCGNIRVELFGLGRTGCGLTGIPLAVVNQSDNRAAQPLVLHFREQVVGKDVKSP